MPPVTRWFIPQIIKSEFSTIWKLSLLSFIIAALTGVLYRYGLLGELPDGLQISNIRHAHTHLMFFNWITPPIMIWMAAAVISPGNAKPIFHIKICLISMMALGFLTWPFFLLYGYNPIPLGSAGLPIAAILSGMVMLTWYWFMWLYYSQRIKLQATYTMAFFDAALVALVVSSLGAWGVSIYQFSLHESPLISKALTSFFLSVFTEGWALLGILGILWHYVEKNTPFKPNWLWQSILFGSMLIFPFSLSESVITPAMLYTAKLGTLLIAVPLTIILYLFVKSGHFKGFIWKTILILITVKIAFQFAAMFPTGIWPGEHGLRVLYLHVFMLGICSILLIQVFNYDRDSIPQSLFTVFVLLILLSLSMISGYLPPWLMLPDLYFWVMIAAFLPIIPAAWIFYSEYIRPKNEPYT